MSDMPMKRLTKISACFAVAIAALAVPAHAQRCGSDGSGFSAWLGQMRSAAASAGISARTIDAALSGITYDANVVRLDRSQRSFKLSFEQFYARRVSSSLINRGHRLMQQHRATLQRVESRFGVPPEVLVAIWGLETNFGADSSGKHSIIRSVATLAYDCRRSDFFRNEVMSTLKIIDRGDMSVSQMRGGWAGEIGQVQFLPSSYFKYAVDFDGDGRRDLVNSVPDMLASTANFLKAHGWRAGQSWQPGAPNYAALQQWNKAEVYSKTIAVMSERMRGAR